MSGGRPRGVIYVVRHGTTDWNQARRTQGRTDNPLNEEGRRQAAEAARDLRSIPLAAVLTSDLVRAVETARTIARPHGLQPQVAEALREIDEGSWEGLTEDDIRARWSDLWDSRFRTRRPNGEHPADVLARARGALEEIARAHPDRPVAVVTSQGVIRWLIADALGMGLEGAGRIRGLRPGEVVLLEASWRDDRLELGEPRSPRGDPVDLTHPEARR